jgi:hypothetical protein
LADIRAAREGLVRTRRGWMEVEEQLPSDVEDAEAGTAMDIGTGGYRRAHIIEGKWRRAARKTWIHSDDSSDDGEEGEEARVEKRVE